MRTPARLLTTGLLSAGLAGLAPAAASSADTAGVPDPATKQSTAPPTAVLPDSAKRPSTKPAPAPATTTPIDPAAPLELGGATVPHATEDVQPGASPTSPQTPAKSKTKAKAKTTAEAQATTGAAAPDGGTPDAPVPPGLLEAMPAEAPADVPSFFIDSFRVPVFLLPIYQAAGIQYGVRWEVLAAINEIETDYGRNLSVSTAGAVGWMQFMPATWQSYGVDANRDGRADPQNPVDAIFAAARYLQAAGAQTDLRAALFAYNHAGWYVTSVLQRAQRLAALPADLVGALTGLAQGRAPVLGKAVVAGRAAARTRSLDLRVKDRSAAVAVTDGTVVRLGRNPRLGRFMQLRDVYGNTYTYGGLASFAKRYPVLRSSKATAALRQAAQAAAPSAPSRKLAGRDLTAAISVLKALAGAKSPAGSGAAAGGAATQRAAAGGAATRGASSPGGPLAAIDWDAQARARFAPPPAAPNAAPRISRPRARTPTGYDRRLLGGVAAERVAYRPLHEGTRVVAGTIIGHATSKAARLRFEIRPAGKDTPRIDPRPIVAGWKLLQTSSPGAPAIDARVAAKTSVGQVLLLGRHELQRLVLDNSKIAIYPCGREDIEAGRVDHRVLATLQLLAMSGLSPTVSSLQCGHSRMTASGNVSEHWSGNAVDISAINGTPILGHQGAGSIAETTIQRLLTLQGTMRPHQIISLMTFQGAANTLALADHADHIHVGFSPTDATPSSLNARLFDGVLEPKAWRRLIDRLAAIDNPRVAPAPSGAAIPAGP